MRKAEPLGPSLARDGPESSGASAPGDVLVPDTLQDIVPGTDSTAPVIPETGMSELLQGTALS